MADRSGSEERFPSNTYTQKKTDPDEVLKVTTGKVKEKKKSLGERVAEAFIATDGRDIKDYFVFDVLIPGLKRAVEDLVHMVLYNDHKSGRVERKNGESRIRRVSYSSVYGNSQKRDEALTARPKVSKTDLIFETRADAEEVLSMMADRVEDAGFATVKYLNALSDMPTDFTQTRWGWHDVSGASIVQTRDGEYLLKMPRVEEVP